jgi:pyruvoyl-dependent arginine decarboxylase (PvlArgDC)
MIVQMGSSAWGMFDNNVIFVFALLAKTLQGSQNDAKEDTAAVGYMPVCDRERRDALIGLVVELQGTATRDMVEKYAEKEVARMGGTMQRADGRVGERADKRLRVLVVRDLSSREEEQNRFRHSVDYMVDHTAWNVIGAARMFDIPAAVQIRARDLGQLSQTDQDVLQLRVFSECHRRRDEVGNVVDDLEYAGLVYEEEWESKWRVSDSVDWKVWSRPRCSHEEEVAEVMKRLENAETTAV